MGGIGTTQDRPLWVRIANFPLTAMTLAVGLYVAAIALGFFLGKYVSLAPPAGTVVRQGIMLALTLLTYKLAIVRLGDHPRDDLRANSAFDLGKGLAVGAVLFTIVVAAAAALGVYRVTGHGAPSAMLLPILTVAITPGFMEEILFRGILFRWIEEFGGSWVALAVTSALFGVAHIFNPGATWFSSFAIAVEAGVLLGGVYMLTRNLWMPVGLHAAWNFTQGAVFGVPVSGGPSNGVLRSELSGPDLLSGGSFGLEASLIAVTICFAAGTWFVWTAVRRGRLVQPWWSHREH